MTVKVDPETGLAMTPENMFWAVEPYDNDVEDTCLTLKLKENYIAVIDIPRDKDTSWLDRLFFGVETEHVPTSMSFSRTLYFHPLKVGVQSCVGEKYDSPGFYYNQIHWRSDEVITDELLLHLSRKIMERQLEDSWTKFEEDELRRNNESYRGVYPPKKIGD